MSKYYTEEEIYTIFNIYYNNLYPFIKNRIEECENLELIINYKNIDNFRLSAVDSVNNEIFLIYDATISISPNMYIDKDNQIKYKAIMSKVKYIWPNIDLDKINPHEIPFSQRNTYTEKINEIVQTIRLIPKKLSVSIEDDIKLLRYIKKERDMLYHLELKSMMGSIENT